MHSSLCTYDFHLSRAFNKHQRLKKIVAYFIQKSRLFSPAKIVKIHLKLVDTVGYSTQTSCLLQILLKALLVSEMTFKLLVVCMLK